MNNVKCLVGVLGAPAAGKSTLAKYLVDEKGYSQIAFADAIKKEFGISKEEFDHLKRLPDGDKIRKELWDFSDKKKKENPNYFINKTMDVVFSTNKSFVINDIRTPEELHAFFATKSKTQVSQKVYLIERRGLDTFKNGILIESKLRESVIEDYSKAYGEKNNPAVKRLYNHGDLDYFYRYLDDVFSKNDV